MSIPSEGPRAQDFWQVKERLRLRLTELEPFVREYEELRASHGVLEDAWAVIMAEATGAAEVLPAEQAAAPPTRPLPAVVPVAPAESEVSRPRLVRTPARRKPTERRLAVIRASEDIVARQPGGRCSAKALFQALRARNVPVSYNGMTYILVTAEKYQQTRLGWDEHADGGAMSFTLRRDARVG
jgi:hypothetical protein